MSSYLKINIQAFNFFNKKKTQKFKFKVLQCLLNESEKKGLINIFEASTKNDSPGPTGFIC
jgi:hypothetical protein